MEFRAPALASSEALLSWHCQSMIMSQRIEVPAGPTDGAPPADAQQAGELVIVPPSEPSFGSAPFPAFRGPVCRLACVNCEVRVHDAYWTRRSIADHSKLFEDLILEGGSSSPSDSDPCAPLCSEDIFFSPPPDDESEGMGNVPPSAASEGVDRHRACATSGRISPGHEISLLQRSPPFGLCPALPGLCE